MGVFTRSRSGRLAGPANLRAGLELDKPDAAQTSSLCGLSVSMYCVATCTRIWICRCQTTVLNTSVCMKPTTGSGNAGTCEKLHDRSRIRLRQKAGVCASALTVWDSEQCVHYCNMADIGQLLYWCIMGTEELASWTTESSFCKWMHCPLA